MAGSAEASVARRVAEAGEAGRSYPGAVSNTIGHRCDAALSVDSSSFVCTLKRVCAAQEMAMIFISTLVGWLAGASSVAARVVSMLGRTSLADKG